MGTIFRQVWRDAEVGEPIEGTDFKHWSEPVIGVGYDGVRDYKVGILGWIGKALFWQKRIVLVPEGPNWPFVIAFRDAHGVCKYSSCIRNVNQGPFMMRIGSHNCAFFVVGQAKIQLKVAGYVMGSMDLY